MTRLTWHGVQHRRTHQVAGSNCQSPGTAPNGFSDGVIGRKSPFAVLTQAAVVEVGKATEEAVIGIPYEIGHLFVLVGSARPRMIDSNSLHGAGVSKDQRSIVQTVARTPHVRRVQYAANARAPGFRDVNEQQRRFHLPNSAFRIPNRLNQFSRPQDRRSGRPGSREASPGICCVLWPDRGRRQ